MSRPSRPGFWEPQPGWQSARGLQVPLPVSDRERDVLPLTPLMAPEYGNGRTRRDRRVHRDLELQTAMVNDAVWAVNWLAGKDGDPEPPPDAKRAAVLDSFRSQALRRLAAAPGTRPGQEAALRGLLRGVPSYDGGPLPA